MNGNIMLTVVLILSAISIVGIIIGLLKRYKRCPSDKLLVVYGKTAGGTAARVIHGGAQFVWPVIQDYEYLDLKPITMEIDLKGALSSQNIRVDVPSSVTISISNQDGIMQNAATHLLGLDRAAIQGQAREIIFGQMRQVISSMSIEQINTDRDTFLKNIQDNLTDELKKIGLKLINVNIQDIKDESGYIEALGKEAAAKAVNDAKVKVADETRKGDIGQAKADQERRTQVAEANAQAEIGEADAEKNRRVAVSEKNASAVKGENEAKITIADSDSTRKIREAEANAKAVSAEKVQAAKAQEEAYVAEKKTEEARADKVQSSLKAEVVVPAQIDKEKVEIAAEAEAERIRRIAKGEADGELAKMIAQGEGVKKILEGMADGFKKIVESAGGNPYAAVQLILADKAEKLMEIQADAIKSIEIGDITVWDSGNGGTTTSDFIQNFLKSAPQYQDLFKTIGLELPNAIKPNQLPAPVVEEAKEDKKSEKKEGPSKKE